MCKTDKSRLYPTTAQAQALAAQVRETCRLYNAALQERRDAYQQAGLSLTYYDDVGLLSFAPLSDGTTLANPRHSS